MDNVSDTWERGDPYEQYVGRWSRRVAAAFLSWLGIPAGCSFASAGLNEAEVRPIDVPTPFASFDDYWQPFLGGQGPAPAYAMSLDETTRARLRERIRERIPVQADGSISMTARAWPSAQPHENRCPGPRSLSHRRHGGWRKF